MLKSQNSSMAVQSDGTPAGRSAMSEGDLCVQRARTGTRPLWALFSAYAVFVVYGTLLPFEFTLDRETLRLNLEWVFNMKIRRAG